MKTNSKANQKDTLSPSRRFAFTVVLLVLAIVVVEAGLHLVQYVRHMGDSDVVDARMLLTPYKDKDWAEEYFIEWRRWDIQYEPCYGWSLTPFQSDYVNIDSSGLRKTWNPPHLSQTPPETLFVFGGSTVWGTGARDDYSIPSYLSRLLNTGGQAIHVVNYGATGYVFRQEVLRLMAALWEGHRPDYVVFLDGTNDVYSAYQCGRAGTFQNVARTRERLKVLSASEHMFVGAKMWLNEYSMIYRAAQKIRAVIFGTESPREAAAGYSEADLMRLSGEIRDSYKQSAELIEHLAQWYGFKYVCFWQPAGFLETNLNAEERGADNRLNDSALGALFNYTNDALPTNRAEHFFNITETLAHRSGTVYIDFCHISEEGNEMVAEKIFSIFQQEILADE